MLDKLYKSFLILLLMNIKNIVLSVAIIILTIFVVVYGINTFYDKPKYDSYCGEFKTQEIIETQERCEEIGGKWILFNDGEIPRPVKPVEGIEEGYCDRDFSCRSEFESASENYYKNLFLITLPLGIAIIILGALVFGLEAVGAGLMGGGVGTILYGVGGYWRYSDNLIKFLLSLIGLIIVIKVAYWFNKKFEGKGKKR